MGNKQDNEGSEKEQLAEEVLSIKDTMGMDLEKAKEILADPTADQNLKEAAEEILAAADQGKLDVSKAEGTLAQEASNIKVNP